MRHFWPRFFSGPGSKNKGGLLVREHPQPASDQRREEEQQGEHRQTERGPHLGAMLSIHRSVWLSEMSARLRPTVDRPARSSTVIPADS